MMRNATAVLTAVAQFLPFLAKTVTSIMLYTGLLGDVLTRVFTFIPYLHPDPFPGGFE
jgi:hypothetical protein